MKKISRKGGKAAAMGLLFFMVPTMLSAQSQRAAQDPPIAQPLVREGELAVKLKAALDFGMTEDEVEAESQLGKAGIAPRNGWIADYPVTPDIIGELQKAVSAAVDAQKLPLRKEEALLRLDRVSTELGVSTQSYAREERAAAPEQAASYPRPTVINNYYYTEGPPVVTYYRPPRDFVGLYTWVPYPFWWYGVGFPGFFILHDFHRNIIAHHRVVCISNHFNDVHIHRVFRVDPVERWNGRTFAGIGVSHQKKRDFIATGVSRSDRKIFNGPRPWGGSNNKVTSGSHQKQGNFLRRGKR